MALRRITRGGEFNVKDYGAVGDGTTNDTAAIIATLVAATPSSYGSNYETGTGVVIVPPGVYMVSAELAIPNHVDLVCLGQRAVTFKLTAAGARIRYGIIPTDGAWNTPSNAHRGGTNGNFFIDGTNVATNGLVIGKTVQRVFQSIEIRNCAGDPWLVQATQNCTFVNVNSDSNAGSGLVLDYGAGGNLFEMVELSSNGSLGGTGRTGNWELKIYQSGTSPSGLGYDEPSINRFISCQFERGGNVNSSGTIYIGAGLANTFESCNIVDGQRTVTPVPLIQVRCDNVNGSSKTVKTRFNNCYGQGTRSGAGTGTTFLDAAQSAGTVSVYFTGENMAVIHDRIFYIDDNASVYGNLFEASFDSDFVSNGGTKTKEQALQVRHFRAPTTVGTPTDSLQTNPSPSDGAFAVDATNTRAYYRNSSAWNRLANFSDITGIPAADFGVRMDAVRKTNGSVSGTTLTGTGFAATDVGKVIYVDGGGTSTTRADGACDPTVSPTANVLTSAGASFVPGDCGSVIKIVGAGTAGADFTTLIRSVISSTSVLLSDTPVLAVAGASFTYVRSHRTTIATYISATQITLTNTPTTAPTFIQTGRSGIGYFYGTDNAAAFNSIGAYLAANTRVTPSLLRGLTNRGPTEIVFGNGACYTSGGNLFGSPSSTTLGWRVRGHGADLTQIVFGPTSTNTFLLTDTDKWGRWSIQGIEFTGIGHSEPNFASITAANSEQGHRFDDIEWSGVWKYVFNVNGTNVGDKWFWNGCRLTPDNMDTFYFVPNTGSIQQLHFRWVGGMAEWPVGDMWHFETGGDIHIDGGQSFVISQKGTYFVLRNNGGQTNGIGAAKLNVVGSRFERRTGNVMLIDSQWDYGVVTFVGVTDTDPGDVTGGTVATDIAALFDVKGGGSANGQFRGPLVLFENCVLKGRHKYRWASSSSTVRRSIDYIKCELGSWDDVTQFIVIEQSDAGSATSAIPVIRFERCRGKTLANGYLNPITCDLNWRTGINHVGRRKIIKVTNQRAKLPSASSSNSVNLPIGVKIEKISLYIRAGDTANTQATSSFVVATSEGSPTTLATFSVNNASLGFYGEVISANAGVLPFICDSAAKATITLTSGVAPNTEIIGDLQIEYVG